MKMIHLQYIRNGAFLLLENYTFSLYSFNAWSMVFSSPQLCQRIVYFSFVGLNLRKIDNIPNNAFSINKTVHTDHLSVRNDLKFRSCPLANIEVCPVNTIL